MPELPEVETMRRGLLPWLEGRRIERLQVLDTRLVRPFDPADVERQVSGRTVTGLARRGKYLLLELDDGLVVAHHPRMTGSFVAGDAASAQPASGQPAATHVRARYEVEGAPHPVLYRDPRRFGTLLVDRAEAIAAYVDARLGPEPLGPGWTGAALHRATRGRSAAIKALLLDQRTVAGLGNIYVDEACFLAGVRPDSVAGDLGRAACDRLVEAARARLEEAIGAGGSTLRDYRGVEGAAGGMQERFLAYARAGRPCLVCGATMRGARVAGRSTSWCPRCQRLPRRRRPSAVQM